VLLIVTVGHDGLPQSITVKKSLFPSLDQSAIEAARKMRFEPAMKDGQPVSEVLLVEFFFSMETKRVSGEGAGVGTGTGMGQGDGVGSGSGSGGAFGVRRRKDDPTGQEDRAVRQAELVQGATISMDRAIQIATSKYPVKFWLAVWVATRTDRFSIIS
jgi:TonB family protein